MAKNKGTESALNQLHAAVAVVLTEQLGQKEKKQEFDADGCMVETDEMVYTAPPATIAAAIKFLKDNQITCDIETNQNMNNLRETLANKQRKSRLEKPGNAALRVVNDD
jgi:HrpA-like RNA helicase